MLTALEREYAACEESVEFVWGILSIDDPLSVREASFWTMNDLSIIRHTDTDEYSVAINSAIQFPDQGINGYKQYIRNLIDKFRDWMISTGRDVNYPVSTYDLFISGASIDTKYSSIEELFSSLDKLVSNLVCSCNVD